MKVWLPSMRGVFDKLPIKGRCILLSGSEHGPSFVAFLGFSFCTPCEFVGHSKASQYITSVHSVAKDVVSQCQRIS